MVIRPTDISDYKRWILWPSNGGSRIVSNICHMTDLAMHLAGNAKPFRVEAVPSTVGRPDLNLTVVLNFEDGSIASILFTDKGCPPSGGGYYEFYHVMKANLRARVDNFTRLEVQRPAHKTVAWKGVLDKGHRAQMAAIAEALIADGPSPIPLDVDAAKRSYLPGCGSVARKPKGSLLVSDVARGCHQLRRMTEAAR